MKRSADGAEFRMANDALDAILTSPNTLGRHLIDKALELATGEDQDPRVITLEHVQSAMGEAFDRAAREVQSLQRGRPPRTKDAASIAGSSATSSGASSV